jgi:acetate kinase
MTGRIAVINAGSSSIKFAICQASRNVDILFRGPIKGIGVAPRLKVRNAQGATVAECTWPADGFDHEAATREILTAGASLNSGTPAIGVGHRVVAECAWRGAYQCRGLTCSRVGHPNR